MGEPSRTAVAAPRLIIKGNAGGGLIKPRCVAALLRDCVHLSSRARIVYHKKTQPGNRGSQFLPKLAGQAFVANDFPGWASCIYKNCSIAAARTLTALENFADTRIRHVDIWNTTAPGGHYIHKMKCQLRVPANTANGVSANEPDSRGSARTVNRKRGQNALTVLLIDDDEPARKGLAAFLRSHGLAVCESQSDAVVTLDEPAVVVGYSVPESTLGELIQARKGSSCTAKLTVLVRGSMDLPFSPFEVNSVNVRESTGELLRLLKSQTRNANSSR